MAATSTQVLGVAAGAWHCPQEHRNLPWFSCVPLSEHCIRQLQHAVQINNPEIPAHRQLGCSFLDFLHEKGSICPSCSERHLSSPSHPRKGSVHWHTLSVLVSHCPVCARRAGAASRSLHGLQHSRALPHTPFHTINVHGHHSKHHILAAASAAQPRSYQD